MLDPKCIYRKSIFAKCTRLACLLSFASLFKSNPKKKHLSSRSCDIRSPDPHIVSSRDEVGKERDNDNEEEGDRESRSHPERLLGHRQILKLYFLKKSN